jgi:hypothetical protein
MQTIELKSLVKQGVVKNISVLRLNVNAYPFVTFLGAGGTAQNVYFGKAFAEEILRKYEEEDNVINDLISAVVVHSTIAAGEVRYKIGRSTKYQSTAAMAAAFGLELDEEVTDFDLADFRAGFEARQEEQLPELPTPRRSRLSKAA